MGMNSMTILFASSCLCNDTVVNYASLFIGENAQGACAIF